MELQAVTQMPLKTRRRKVRDFVEVSDNSEFTVRSWTGQLRKLPVGASLAKVEQINPKLAEIEARKILQSSKRRLLNNVEPLLRIVRRESGRRFKVASGDVVMPRGQWFVVVCVTRTQ